MAAATSVTVQLNGQDKTKAAFDSVAKRAKESSNKIGAALKAGAIAVAVGAVVKKVADALDGLNKLNDIAQQAGMKAEWLQRFVGTMGQAGINITTEGLVASVQKLNAALVNTEKIRAFEKLGIDVSHLVGLRPEDAFLGFLEVVAAIPDEQTRLLALQRGLEEQGLRLAPLLRQGPDNFRASLEAVMGVIPAASEQTVSLATNANNAFALVGQNFQTIWHEALGSVLAWADETFGGVDKVIMRLWERLKAFGMMAVRVIQQIGEFLAGAMVITQIYDISDGLEVLFYRIAQWGNVLLTPFIKLAEVLGMDGLAKNFAWVEEEIERRINHIYDKYGLTPTSTLAEKIGQDFLDAQAKIEEWDAALDAKKTLSSFANEGLAQIPKLELQPFEPASLAPMAESVRESVKTAVRTGTEQGLMDGIEGGSYEALKTTFAAGAVRMAAGQTPASVQLAQAETSRASADRLSSIETLLRQLLDSVRGGAKTLAALETF